MVIEEFMIRKKTYGITLSEKGVLHLMHEEKIKIIQPKMNLLFLRLGK